MAERTWNIVGTQQMLLLRIKKYLTFYNIGVSLLGTEGCFDKSKGFIGFCYG